jgi:hypothetical protein
MWRWNIARSSQRFDRRAECAALVYWPRIGPDASAVAMGSACLRTMRQTPFSRRKTLVALS